MPEVLQKSIGFACLLGLTLYACHQSISTPDRPNVILIMTDDQGIGDLGCHGNPWLKTPHIDAFYKDAVRLTDFHVSPVCTPTRSALMTGKYPINNGAWATYKGRDALPLGSKTMADFFREAGYRTGIFGKWHLGDNYPSRATDCGFDVAVHHKAGGVGELSDHWGNRYFDDVYYVNNEPHHFNGYCTDVWFSQAMDFIRETKDQPFFAYIPTNVPHSPFLVEDKYAAPYQHLEGEHIVGAHFYGMLANMDENFGRLMAFLAKQELEENTLVIFMTDNGSGGGVSADGSLGHNFGFRGKKGDKTEGGHRVPFFIRWPGGEMHGGRDLDGLTAHIDLLPTLGSICALNLDGRPMDGIDFSPTLTDAALPLEDRTLYVHHRQDWRPPDAILGSCIATERWRLINGNELYDIERDRLQTSNVADLHPEVVEALLARNQAFVAKAREHKEYQEFPSTIIGSAAQDQVKLTIQHAIGEDKGIWKAEHVAQGLKNTNNTHALEVLVEGTYRISCRRWPLECPGPIRGVPTKNPRGGMYQYDVIAPQKVRLQIANQLHEEEIREADEAIVFELHLQKGKTMLTNDFIEDDRQYGVYYTYIEKLD